MKPLIGIGFVAALVGAGWAAAPLVFGQAPATTGPANAADPPAAKRWRTAPAAAPAAVIRTVPEGSGWFMPGSAVLSSGYPSGYCAAHGEDPECNKLAGEEAEAAREADALAHQYGEADDDKSRDDVKSKLAAALEKQFESQQKLRELEISRIETRVRKLRELLIRRNDARRTIIDKRLDQLVREAEGLGWSSATGAGQGLPYTRFNNLGGAAPVVVPSPARRQ